MKPKEKIGFSLPSTLIVMTVISALMALLIQNARQSAFTSTKLIDRIKATTYAEAGFEHALAKLNDNWADRYDANALMPSASGVKSLSTRPAETDESTSASSDYGDGAFHVQLTPMGENGRYCLIQSTGSCGDEHVDVEVMVEDFLADSNGGTTGSIIPSDSAWANTVYANGTMNLGGNGDIDGSLHANSTLKMNGSVEIGPDKVNLSSSSKISVNGNVKADGTFTAPTIRVTGNKESDAVYRKQEVPRQEFPQLDLSDYYQTALANGQVINGNVKKSNDINWKDVPGGVVWVNGYIKLSANAMFNCTVIATGYINITGNVNDGLGAPTGTQRHHIISRDGDIKIAGNTEVHGVLYTPSDVSLSGNASIYGAMVAGGDVTINGNVDVINYDELAVTDLIPPEETARVHLVGVSAWQK